MKILTDIEATRKAVTVTTKLATNGHTVFIATDGDFTLRVPKDGLHMDERGYDAVFTEFMAARKDWGDADYVRGAITKKGKTLSYVYVEVK